MPNITEADVDREFSPQTIITRDGVDEIAYQVVISNANRLRIIGAVTVETDIRNMTERTVVDMVRVGEAGLDCVRSWEGVTQDGEPVGFSREVFVLLPHAHVWAFFHAFRVWALTGEFPLLVLPLGGEAATGEEAPASEGEDSSPDESAG
jgi:hypothetical protein